MAKRLILAALLWLAAWPALAAVAFDAESTTSAVSSGGPNYSWTHTPVGTPTAVEVSVSIYATTVTGVTYGGVAMAQAVSALTGTGPIGSQPDSDYIFCLTSPPSGPQTVTVSTSAANQYIIAAAVTVTGSSTSTCFRNTASIQPAASPASTSVTTVAGDLVVDLMDAFGSASATPGGSQTLAWGPISAAALYAAGSYQAAAGTSTTMSWTYLTGTNQQALLIAAFEQGSGGGSTYHGLLLQGIGK